MYVLSFPRVSCADFIRVNSKDLMIGSTFDGEESAVLCVARTTIFVLKGWMDDLAIFNYALTQNEILNIAGGNWAAFGNDDKQLLV